MGFELVYCYKCQKRLTEDDFKGGKAYRIGIHTSCIGCSDELLKQLTPAQQKAVIEQSRITVSAKESTRVQKPPQTRPTTVHGRTVPPGTVPPQPVEMPPAEKKKPPIPLIAGAGGGALLLIVILVMVFSGNGDETKPPTGGGTPPGGVTDPDIPSADPKQVQAALDALRLARAQEEKDPKNHPEIIRLYETAAKKAKDTAYAEEALRGRDAAVARYQLFLKGEIGAFEKEIRAHADAKTYQQALDQIEAARTRHAARDWTQAMDRMKKEIWDAAAGNFLRVKTRAIEDTELGKPPETVQAWRDEVAKWGIQQYVEDLDKALAAVGSTAGAGTTGGTAPPPTPATPAPAATAKAGELGPYDLDGTGHIRHWLVAGVFPNPNRTGLRFDFLNGEAAYTPNQGLAVTGLDGTKTRWSAYASPEDKITFERVPHLDWSAGRDFVLAYAACWLESEKDQEVRLVVNSDDGYRLWVGEKRIAEATPMRGIHQGEETHTVRLKQGKQRVLIKVDDTTSFHEFRVRVATPQGGRALGVKVWN